MNIMYVLEMVKGDLLQKEGREKREEKNEQSFEWNFSRAFVK